MKRYITLALVLLLCATLSPALAFSDVPADAWYAESAALCQETGLMNGAGEDTFRPDDGLTLAEVMTVSCRLHYQANGGTGELPTAPADWGTGALSTTAGALLLTFDTRLQTRGFSYIYGIETPRRLHLFLEVSPEELNALTPAGGPAEAVLTLNGRQVLTGELSPAPDGSRRMEFVAAEYSDYTAFNREYAAYLPAPADGLWYRSALWYAREHGLLDAQPMATAFEHPATRQDLAEWLCSALPPEVLPPINTVETLPDSAEPEVLALYRAGILSGVDETGRFGGEQPLTRAQLAVILARVIDPSRRLVFTSST